MHEANTNCNSDNNSNLLKQNDKMSDALEVT